MSQKKECPNILIIDDEESIIASIKEILSDQSYTIHDSCDGKQGIKLFSEIQPNLVIVDYRMPEMNGLEFIKSAKSIHPHIPIIVLTAHGDKDLSLSFLREGAYRYIEKPFDLEEFKLIFQDAMKHGDLLQENTTLQTVAKINKEFPEIIGKSRPIGEVLTLVNKVSQTDISILIEGESGTGKELIAKAIHDKSELKGPFVKFNCAALPETLIESELFGHEKGAFTGADQQKLGRFELAEGGTLFIDEVGELNMTMQVKLLRILQEKEFERVGGTSTIKSNARVVTATNRNLKEMVNNNEFREDLYYRLNVFPIYVPALRERKEDILLLAQHFSQIYSQKYNKKVLGFHPIAKDLLTQYQWKGNIRELQNVISRSVILSQDSLISEKHLGLSGHSTTPLLQTAIQQNLTEEDLIKLYAKEVYTHFDFNKKASAEFLNINYRTLNSRLS